MAENAANLEYWNKLWAVENPPWASAARHKWLATGTNLEVLLRGRQNQKIFFPLCGDVIDMKWLGDLGHTIVGVDVGKGALEGFFVKHNITYTTEECTNCQGTLYKSENGKYRLYCCDFFKFNSELEKDFDAIFDSAALAAIHPDLRNKYAEILMEISTPDTLHLVEATIFDEITWEGPPYGLTGPQLKQYYEPRCDVKLVDTFMFSFSEDDGHQGDETGNHGDNDGNHGDNDGNQGDDGGSHGPDTVKCEMYTLTLKA